VRQYYVCWWSEYQYGVGISGFENAVILANSDVEAKEKIEKEHSCMVNSLIDVWSIKHPLKTLD
jgi:hypothetical protein